MNWTPIDRLQEHLDSLLPFSMVVAIAKDVPVGTGKCYTTDPYCVWRQFDGTFARWPHDFPPTHFCVLPGLK